MTLFLELVAVAALILLNGFFVAAEYGLVTARRTKIAELEQEGNRRARAVQTIVRDPPRFIAAMQLGVTLTSLAIGAVGEPVLTNGMAMCAIHHRAFDAHVLTVTPDYRIEISPKVLAEHDGPTLQYALQSLHGEAISLPQHRAEHPDRELLEERYDRFRAAV